MLENMTEVRLNKYLADQGIASRRQADVLIAAGRIRINGKVAKLGAKVTGTDKVEVAKQELESLQKKRVYFAYYKPIGLVTHSPKPGQKAILDVIKIQPDIFPVGRLDRASEGLLILTNDGRITEKLLSPELKHEKEYVVTVDKPTTENMLTRLKKGIKLEDGYITKPAKATGQVGSYTFNLIITEGKKHQIRRMCTALGYAVLNLKRIRVGSVRLADLQPGAHRKLGGVELKKFLTEIGL